MKTIWCLRVSCLLTGFLIAVLIPSSQAQSYPYQPRLGLSRLDIAQLEMRSMEKQYAEDQKEREKARLKAEFDADKRDYEYTKEMAILYISLMQHQDALYASKYPPLGEISVLDMGAQIQVELIKQELLKREKQTRKHLERR